MNKRHYEHTLPNIRGSLSNTYITLQDPDPNISPDMVMNYYSNMYPELTTATVHGPVIREDMTEYEFKTTIGTKG